MLIRALIVVLAMFNAGVALWWWSQPAVGDAPVPAMSPPDGVPVLQLRAEVALPESADGNPRAVQAAEPEPPASPSLALAAPPKPAPAEPMATAVASPDSQAMPVVAEPAAVCVSLGAFADQAALEAARQRAGSVLASSRVRELASGAGVSYRVMLPPAENREAAQATVKQIVAAGISDYFIIGQGELANAVALGQFRNRDGAQRRLEQLQDAGFPARIVPSEPSASRWWLDARLAAGQSAVQARQASGAERVQSLDCGVLR